MSTTFGQRLGIAMRQRGVKAPTLAARAGTTRQNIYGLLKDRTTNPDSGVVVDLADELLVSVEWLLTGRGPMLPGPALSDDESTLVHAFREMTPKDRRRLLRIAVSLSAETDTPPSRSNPFKK